jgi:hypothetical protein
MANSLQRAIDSTARVYQTEEQIQYAVHVLFFRDIERQRTKIVNRNIAVQFSQWFQEIFDIVLCTAWFSVWHPIMPFAVFPVG